MLVFPEQSILKTSGKYSCSLAELQMSAASFRLSWASQPSSSVQGRCSVSCGEGCVAPQPGSIRNKDGEIHEWVDGESRGDPNDALRGSERGGEGSPSAADQENPAVEDGSFSLSCSREEVVPSWDSELIRLCNSGCWAGKRPQANLWRCHVGAGLPAFLGLLLRAPWKVHIFS